MYGVFKSIYSISVANLGILTILLASFTSLATDDEIPSAKVAFVEAQIMIDSGEHVAALAYLQKALKVYPNDDSLYVLYGDALFENKQITEAEEALRKALDINPLNNVATAKIALIREISNAAVSEKAQLYEELTLDKLFDLVAMALAFALGTLLSRYIRNISDWNFTLRSRKLFLKGDYDDFVDLLEIQISTNQLRPLRKSIDFMLSHMSTAESLTILNQYVNTEDNLNTLTRMVKLSEQHAPSKTE